MNTQAFSLAAVLCLVLAPVASAQVSAESLKAISAPESVDGLLRQVMAAEPHRAGVSVNQPSPMQ